MATLDRRQLLYAGALAGLGYALTPPLDPRQREVERFFAFARRELGELLDDVALRIERCIKRVLYKDVRTGKVVGFFYDYDGPPSTQKIEERKSQLARQRNIPAEAIGAKVYDISAGYDYKKRTIILSRERVLNREKGPILEDISHEAVHAAINVDYRGPHETAIRHKDEAVAVALGKVQLVMQYKLGSPLVNAALVEERARKQLLARAELFRTEARFRDDPIGGLSYGFTPEDIDYAARLAGSRLPIKEKLLQARRDISALLG